MDRPSKEQIRERSHQLWEAAGKPEGRHEEFGDRQSTSFALAKKSTGNSDFATFVRTIVIVLAAAMIVLVTGNWQQPSTVSVKTWAFLVLSGLATGASWICYIRALKLGDAARVAPVDKLSVLLVAVFGFFFFREHLSVPNWIGITFIAVGAMLVAYRS